MINNKHNQWINTTCLSKSDAFDLKIRRATRCCWMKWHIAADPSWILLLPTWTHQSFDKESSGVCEKYFTMRAFLDAAGLKQMKRTSTIWPPRRSQQLLYYPFMPLHSCLSTSTLIIYRSSSRRYWFILFHPTSYVCSQECGVAHGALFRPHNSTAFEMTFQWLNSLKWTRVGLIILVYS